MIPWIDPREWMEDMNSARWKERVKFENRRFAASVAKAASKVLRSPKEFESLVGSFRGAQKVQDEASAWTVCFEKKQLVVVPARGGSFYVGPYLDRLEKNPVGDLDLYEGGYRVTSHDIGSGAEKYEIRCLKEGKRIWTFRGSKEGLGPYVAIMKGRVYCLEAESPLRYTELVSVDLVTGSDRQVHFVERDRSSAMSLFKGGKRTLFLISENSGRQRCYWINGDGEAVLVCPQAIRVIPLGSFKREPEALVRLGDFLAPWTLVTKRASASFKIPKGLEHCGVEAIDTEHHLVVLKDRGLRRLVSYKTGKLLKEFIAEVSENPWSSWLGGKAEFKIEYPGVLPFPIELHRDWKIYETPYANKICTDLTTSADGEQVRWLLVRKSERCRGLLVCVYGAYGIPTSISTARWRPFLDAGFAVGFALPRGGGDDGDAWAEAGRREGKLRCVEDTEACIRALQKRAGLEPKKTVLFGRSAGGYVVGAIVARHPAGDLIGTAYAEVPYVDVLKTASNASLPLTEYEYLEFGNPAKVLADFETMVRLSPIHALGPKGAPAVSVLTRTGVNDMQVLPYEPVKWIDALGGGKEKIVYVADGSGHFTRGGGEFVERAEDLCWIVEKIGQ
jgi:hypothetical protein